MTTTEQHNDSAKAGTEAADELAALFRHVGARERPPEEDERAVRAAVHGAWCEVVGGRKNRRLKVVWGLAASIALVVALALTRGVDTGAVPVVAEVLTIAGQATIGSGTAGSVQTGQGLRAGEKLRAGAQSGLVLRWTSGATVRVGESTEIALESQDALWLARGAVYVDTGETRGLGTPAVVTPAGRVSHLGTRYMVRVSATTTRVSVRDGEVAVRFQADDAAAPLTATSGQRLSIAPSGESRIEPVATWGEDWHWADQLASGFDADGRSLAELFDWAAHETGRKLVYASGEGRRLAATAQLHGSLKLPPAEALAVASATSDLVAEIHGGEIRVRIARP